MSLIFPNFTYWLMKQRHRDDPIGDLANDFYKYQNNRFPFHEGIPICYELNMELLIKLKACHGAIQAFRYARVEHRRWVRQINKESR